MLVYLDGRFVPEAEAKVSVFDHGYLYGDGVFEGIRAYHGRVFKLEDHVRRLYDSAKAIMLEIPVAPEQMGQIIVDSCRRNALREAYIRVVVSRGEGDLGLDPRKCPRPTVVVIASTLQLFPAELYRTGLKVMTVATRRNICEGVNPRIKSLNYLNNVMAKLEANLAGYSEVLMLNHDGYVAEGTGDNIFLVDGRDTLVTPPSSAGILEGITRNTILEMARRLGMRAEEKLITRYDVYVAAECFLTGTAAEVIPVTSVDGRCIGSGRVGPVTQLLMEEFRRLTQREGTPIFPEMPEHQAGVCR